MSIQSEAERIKANVAAAYAVAAELGAEMPDAQNSDNLAETVADAKAVLYTPQELTDEQQTQARANIGAASADDVSQLSKEIVTHTTQTLTDEQQAQARQNVGALGVSDFGTAKAGRGLYVGKDGQITTDPIPSEAKLREYAALFDDSKEVESFLFFADPHIVFNDTLAKINGDIFGDLQIIRNYFDCTPTNFALCTGDWINDDYDGAGACFLIGYVRAIWRKWFPNGCFVVGNHEYNDCGTKLLTAQTVNNLLLPEHEKNYYTYDGAITRFYVLDTGTLGYDVTDYGWEQIDWLAKQLITDKAQFSAIASHIWYVADTDGTLVLTPFADAVLQLAQAYNTKSSVTLNGETYSFEAATGRVEFAIGGHKHVDKTAEEYGIPVILNTCVSIAGYGRPTFDLVLADYTNRKLHFVRIGSYSNRTVELPERNDLITYTNLVPTSIEYDSDAIYNEVGYKNDVRTSGTAPYEQTAAGFTYTGYIPWPRTDAPIYVKGIAANESSTGTLTHIVFFKTNKTRAGIERFGHLDDGSNAGFALIQTKLAENYYRIDFKYYSEGLLQVNKAWGNDISYFRIDGIGDGANLIVTIGEPIE